MKPTLRHKTFLIVGGVALGSLLLTVAVFLRIMREEKLSSVFEGNVAAARAARDRLDADLAAWNASLSAKGDAGLRAAFAAAPELLELQVSRAGSTSRSAADKGRLAAAGFSKGDADAAGEEAAREAVGAPLPRAHGEARLLTVVGRAGDAAYSAVLDLEALDGGVAARGLSLEVLPAAAAGPERSPLRLRARAYLASGVTEGAFREREDGEEQLASFVSGRSGPYVVIARRPYSAVTAAQRRFLGQIALLAALVALAALAATATSRAF